MSDRATQTVAVWSNTRGQGTCKSCHAPITWYRTVGRNRAIPFDADPVALRTRQDPETRRLIEELDAADVHFRSCPDADEHRKER